MAKKAEARGLIYLACPVCKDRAYTTSKNRKNDTQRLELNKYCPRCRVHRQFKEAK